jgi:ABC-2 type transport system permease protein
MTMQPPRRTGLLAVTRREIHVIAHSPFYLLFTFILPLASFGVLCGTFYREIPRDLPIVVCDKDHSNLSRRLTRMADAAAALAVAATVEDMLEGAEAVRTGEAYAILYIPSGFEQRVERGEAPAVTAYYNNQWLLTSSVISRAARDVVGTLSAGIDVRTRMMRGESPSQARERYEPIRLDAHMLFNPNLNYRYFLLPAVLAGLLQVFVIAVAVRAIGTELRHGTAAEWLAVAGGGPWRALLGKMLPYSVCFIVMVLFMLTLLMRFFGLPMYGSMDVLIVASILFVLAYQSMGFLIVTLSANLRLANSLAGFFSGPALAFAGITYPVIGMPLPAKIWSASLPVTHYLRILLEQALRGAPVQASAPTLLVLALFVMIPPALLVPRLGRLMRGPQYWGRL